MGFLRWFLAASISLTFLLVLIMLPAYFIRKRKNPEDKKNTIKRLILLSFVAASIMTLFMGSGLIVMYLEDLFYGG